MRFLVRPVSLSKLRGAVGICTASYTIGECVREIWRSRGVLGGVPALALALSPALQLWIWQPGVLGSLLLGLAVAGN